jgi:quinol monooxygenase YgiN
LGRLTQRDVLDHLLGLVDDTPDQIRPCSPPGRPLARACVRLTDAVSDPTRLLVAELHGLVGSQDELRALLDELATGADGEPGCADFQVLSAEEPGEFVLLSSWVDEQALREHYATPHYRHYRSQVGLLLARPSDVVVHHVSMTVKALDPNPPDPGELG